MKNIKIEFTNERIIPASGLAVVGAILGKSDFVRRCNRMDVTKNRSQHQIKNGDILLTHIGLLTMGKPAYESVHEFDDKAFCISWDIYCICGFLCINKSSYKKLQVYSGSSAPIYMVKMIFANGSSYL